MASKQSEAKDKQGFVKQAPSCSNCVCFDSTIETTVKWGSTYKNETNLRCTLGNFKVGKSNYCDKHERIIN